MGKLLLDPETLEVESFPASVGEEGHHGTVHAFATAVRPMGRCYPGGDSDFNVGCEPGLTNDEYTCVYNDCQYSLNPTDCQGDSNYNTCSCNGGLYSCVERCTA